jgi:hypothetical protein
MRYFIVIILFSIVGCTQRCSECDRCRRPQHIEPPPPEVVNPKEKPPTIDSPSKLYLSGYDDGYYGTWLDPVKWRWDKTSDYRHGWQAGNYDRTHGLSHRYPKK